MTKYRFLTTGSHQMYRFMRALTAGVVAGLSKFVLAILLARGLGPEDYGVFAFAIGAAMLTANVATLGWPNLFNRLLPAFLRDKDWGRIKGLRDCADLVIVTTLALAAIVLVLFSGLDEKLRLGLTFAAMLVAPLGLVMLRKQQLAALKRPAIGLLFDQGFAAIVVSAVVLITGIADLQTVVAMYVGATAIGVVITTVMVRHRLPDEIGPAQRVAEVGKWFRTALPMAVGTLSKTLINRMDVLMLAPLASLHAVGIYGAAWRLTYVLTFPQVVLMTVVTPLLSEAFAHGQTGKVQRIMRLSAIYAFVTTLPFLAVFLVAPDTVMGWIFGDEFIVGGSTLLILGLAQFLAAFTNANAALLMMGGREKQFGAINVTVMAIAFALNILLIPRYGANGAAMTILTASALLLAGQVYFSRQLINKMSASS